MPTWAIITIVGLLLSILGVGVWAVLEVAALGRAQARRVAERRVEIKASHWP